MHFTAANVAPPTVRRPHRIWFVLAILVVLIYLCAVAREYLGEQWAESGALTSNVDELTRATHWLPDDAAAFHALGLQLSTSPDQYPRAISALTLATQLSPYDATNWLDLASVCDAAGRPAERDQALESAIAAEPNNPDVADEAANYYLTAGNLPRALSLLRLALLRDPSSSPSFFPPFLRATHNPQLLLDHAIPPDPHVLLDFLRIMVDQHQSTGAAQTWQRLLSTVQATAQPASPQQSSTATFQPQQTLFYFDYLLRDHDAAAFAADWKELAQVSPSLRAYLPTQNLIVNGSFEHPILDAGLDWKFEPVAHITSVIDNSTAHSGSRSLSLTYDGEPAYQAGWREYVPVKSGATYKFTAWIKSEDLTSSSGPRFVLTDSFNDSVLLLTQDILDTHPWQQVEGQVHVPSGTSLVTVTITRSPANTRISGKAWIDDLSIEEVNP
jgi:tetratricopeptide (TPR) repeat protein